MAENAVPTHTVEVYRGDDNEFGWRKIEFGNNENVAHDYGFFRFLSACRDAAEANPEITHLIVPVDSLWTPEQKKRKERHEAAVRARIESRERAQGKNAR